MKVYRYPGVRPFEAADKALFFGRDRDIADLYEMVRAERLVVLFGKSGYGKSSLLNAGVLPRLSALMTPVEVRLGEYIAGQSLPPVETVQGKAPLLHQLQPDAAFLTGLPPTLWTHFKQLDSAHQGSYLLVFDQFEEFFSYPPEQQRAFRDQLADLLNGELPEALREPARALEREQRRLLAAPMDIRVLFAIRSDRLHELDRLKDRLPAILHKRYELKALAREQAREAIVQPALLTLADAPEDSSFTTFTRHKIGESGQDSSFFSPPFEYREDALQKILAGLAISNAAQQTGVEAFQLQILCDNIENRVGAGLVPDRNGDGLADVTADDLPDFTEVFAQYYERRLGLLPESQRVAARRVIEDGLVRYDPATDEGRRLSVDGQALLKDFEAIGLNAHLLRELENTFLVRREPNTLGGHNYELSHDTLLAPVVQAKKRRMVEEAEQRRIAAEAAEKERLRLEGEKVRKGRRRNVAIGLAAMSLLCFALALMAAVWEARADAKMEQQNAVKAKQEAAEATRVSEQKEMAATEADKRAKRSEEIANLEQMNARTQQDNARLMQLKAEQAAEQAVLALLSAARKDILELHYDAAFSKLKNAAGLGSVKDSVAFELMEIAFFRYHAGHPDQATAPFMMAAKLLGKLGVLTKNDFKKAIVTLNKGRDSLLNARYFPVMLDIKGGAFSMRNDAEVDNVSSIAKPSYQVTVSDFRMAKTETTVWQYNLYLAAQGKDINDPKVIEGPGWDWEGNNPVVNVRWYDAIRYANWLSAQQSFSPTIDTSGGDFLPDWNASGYRYRLPTEAEWEYAARGAAQHEAFSYSGGDDPDSVAWYFENSGNRTRDVATKKANGAGLFDMSGNVDEWCRDWRSYSPPEEDPKRSEIGANRVIRGGSWAGYSSNCRVANSDAIGPGERLSYVGFRLVLSFQ